MTPDDNLSVDCYSLGSHRVAMGDPASDVGCLMQWLWDDCDMLSIEHRAEIYLNPAACKTSIHIDLKQSVSGRYVKATVGGATASWLDRAPHTDDGYSNRVSNSRCVVLVPSL